MSGTAGSSIRHPPIDVGAVVRRSYRHVGEDFLPLLAVSLAAALTLGVAELILTGAAYALFGADPKPADFGSGYGVILSVAAFGIGVLRYLLMVAVAVHWHRSILVAEHSWRNMAISVREGRYLIWLFAWFVAFAGVMILVYSTLRYLGADFRISDWLGDRPGTSMVQLLIAAAVYAVLVAPFYVAALVLPAKAVDEKGFGFLEALRLTRGNFWRIAAASLFFKPPIVVLILFTFGVAHLIPEGGAVTRFFLSVAVDTATFVWICLEAGFLSFVYQALHGSPAAAGR